MLERSRLCGFEVSCALSGNGLRRSFMAIERLPSGKYRVRIRSKNLTYDEVLPEGTTKEEAKAIESSARLGMRSNLLRKKTLAEFITVWFRHYAHLTKNEDTIQSNLGQIKKHFLPSFGHMRFDEIRPKDLMRWRNDLESSGAKYKTIKNVQSLLKQIFDAAIMEEECSANIVTSLPRMTPPRERSPVKPFLHFNELDQLLDWSKDRDYDFYQTILFMTNTGLRPGELMDLRRKHIDFNRRLVQVRSTWVTRSNRSRGRTKNGLDRDVPLSQAVMGELRFKQNLEPDSRLFPWVIKDYCGRVLKPYLKAAEIKRDDIVFKSMRHTFGSHYVMRQAALINKAGLHVNPKIMFPIQVQLRDLMGHKSVESTNSYMHLCKDSLEGATDILTTDMDWVKRISPVYPSRYVEGSRGGDLKTWEPEL